MNMRRTLHFFVDIPGTNEAEQACNTYSSFNLCVRSTNRLLRYTIPAANLDSKERTKDG
jgi:hypothetical protein